MESSFCRGPFWNDSLTWNSTDPQLTPCFRNTVLAGIPGVFLWLIGPLWLRWIYKRNSDAASRLQRCPEQSLVSTLLFTFKILLSLILAAVIVLQWHVDVTLEGQSHFFPEDYFYLCIMLSSLSLSLVLVLLERRFVVAATPTLCLYWLFFTVITIPDFKQQIRRCDNWSQIVLACGLFPVALLQLFLHSVRDPGVAKVQSPEEDASFVSQVVFSWMDPLIWFGYKTTLTQDKLPNAPKHLKVEHNIRSFQTHWARARQSLWLTLLKMNATRIAWSTFLGVVHHVLVFANPQLLRLLIAFVEEPDQPAWQGYLYSTCLLICSFLSTVTFHVYMHHVTTLGIQIKSAIMSRVYDKSLKLGHGARRQFSVGEITNLMSVDSQRISDVVPYLSNVWAAPLQIGLALYFLYQELGYSLFAGLVVILLLIPVNVLTTKKLEHYEELLLSNKDVRINLLNEMLPGIKVLKMYAWEPSFMKRISEARGKEIGLLKKIGLVMAVVNVTYYCTPTIVTAIVFGVYVLVDPVNNVLDAQKIFVSLSLFNLMRLPLLLLPWSLIEWAKLVVSINRISRFLLSEEIDPHQVSSHMIDPQSAIEIQCGDFSWGSDEGDAILKDINVKVAKGSLTAIVGPVGSGKTSLLCAMLGEMSCVGGNVNRTGSVALVAQQAWIQHLSLKDNVLFGKEMDSARYQQVVSACALEPDIEVLAHRDETEIGENGINLSGGQKQRVALARAVYADADLYFLDDPLSAVDAHVGKSIFEQVISNTSGLLRHKTRLLVTNSVHLLANVDLIIVMKEGRVLQQGTFSQLTSSPDSAFLIMTTLAAPAQQRHTTSRRKRKNTAKSLCAVSKPLFIGSHLDCRIVSPYLSKSYPVSGSLGEKASQRLRSRRLSVVSSSDESDSEPLSQDRHPDRDFVPGSEDDSAPLIEDETIMTGRVRWSVYLHYIKSAGLLPIGVILVMYLASQSLQTGASIWLSLWADQRASSQLSVNLGVYSGLGLVDGLVQMIRELIMFVSFAKASKVIHDKLLHHVIHSPMYFFDTNPTGRIVNRFSADMETVDQSIPFEMSDFLSFAAEVASILIIIGYSTPNFLLAVIPLFALYLLLQKYYITTSRQIKRLESVNKSPIFSFFSETVTGASTIRCFSQEARFQALSDCNVDRNLNCLYLIYSSNRWLGTRIESIGNMVLFLSSLLAVLARDSVSPGMVGLSVTYALKIVDTLNWMVRMVCELETNCVALERILEYTNNPQEADWDWPEAESGWPSRGQICIRNLQTRYRPGLSLALKGVHLTVEPGEKIGICGRTGAGKTSFALSLMRICEASDGEILIDGVNIALLGLHQLRSRLTVIPQDPILFSGTVRFNLDPTACFSDEAIWQALDHAYIKEHVASLPHGLSHEVKDQAASFSVGQRQLLCLARALLRKSKLLILDEATASVDLETDRLLQATIRSEFADCTVITIAHRLNTLLDSSRVAVFHQGQLHEVDSPARLMGNPDSLFYSLAKEAGLLAH